MPRFYFSLIFCLLTFLTARAQLYYKFTAVSGTYTPIAGGDTAILLPEDLSVETHDDGISTPIPIGFIFTYNRQNFTSIIASTNGFVSFKPLLPIANSRDNYYMVPDLMNGPYSAINTRPILAPLWDDHDLYYERGMVYKTTGVSPNRVFTLQWDDVYWNIYATKLTMTFQLKLFETTDVVEFHYKRLPGAVPAEAGASIGITATEFGPGTFMSLENTSTSPTINRLKDVYTLRAKPASNQVYRFTPIPIYISAAKGNWSDPATWQGSVIPPTGFSAVIIRHKVTGDINTTCNFLTVEKQGDLLLNNGINISIAE